MEGRARAHPISVLSVVVVVVVVLLLLLRGAGKWLAEALPFPERLRSAGVPFLSVLPPVPLVQGRL